MSVAREDETTVALMSYSELKAELESIVETLGAPEVNVDEVASLVCRARDIITECRSRIRVTREEVETILGESEDA